MPVARLRRIQVTLSGNNQAVTRGLRIQTTARRQQRGSLQRPSYHPKPSPAGAGILVAGRLDRISGFRSQTEADEEPNAPA